MKIIKQGVISKTIRKFTCSNCGSIFECDKDEYNTFHSRIDGDYCSVKCPVCKKPCYCENH